MVKHTIVLINFEAVTQFIRSHLFSICISALWFSEANAFNKVKLATSKTEASYTQAGGVKGERLAQPDRLGHTLPLFPTDLMWRKSKNKNEKLTHSSQTKEAAHKKFTSAFISSAAVQAVSFLFQMPGMHSYWYQTDLCNYI